MICGLVGCGRYFKQHAVTHKELSGHQFSMEISSQRIWNYYGDAYVHRFLPTAATVEPHHSTGAAAMLLNKYIDDSCSEDSANPHFDTQNTFTINLPEASDRIKFFLPPAMPP